jgi:hypothetical protein
MVVSHAVLIACETTMLCTKNCTSPFFPCRTSQGFKKNCSPWFSQVKKPASSQFVSTFVSSPCVHHSPQVMAEAAKAKPEAKAAVAKKPRLEPWFW